MQLARKTGEKGLCSGAPSEARQNTNKKILSPVSARQFLPKKAVCGTLKGDLGN